MRRGGRGSNVQAPWRGHDLAIPSALHLDRRWAVGNYVKVVGLAGCSAAICITTWNLRLEPHLHGQSLQSRKPGFVFPLYRHCQQHPNGSHGVGGNRVRNGRGVRSDESNPIFELHAALPSPRDHRPPDLYTEIELGVPPKPFAFRIDTGSGSPWLLCQFPNSAHVSTIKLTEFGPNGLYVSKEESILNCTGATASLCRALQHTDFVECKQEDQYKCFFSVQYLDDSDYKGGVVKESVTVSMQDNTERKATASPFDDFLIVKPENYLAWDADRNVLCVNMVPGETSRRISVLGGT